ncbi:Lysophospholipase, alpha-beta hydrolase superfamily [Marinospirillum celere]|uniref:Lysophospholipase, alpha-beta hydrolase superfamily n=1 Tax=Marinospirillum celere TaxID=1122252 RepID=A0A1I1JMM8_9GAMM|nr:alpha/beta hydrolase [Marinospirillum celere]SFC47828.1 Lysophospholipase, alpha-beta hydrolase superfamily [Marinospirillum celere]
MLKQEDTGFCYEIHPSLGEQEESIMQAPAFKVSLRLWPHTFLESSWTRQPEKDYADYLSFYGMASVDDPLLAQVRAGWVLEGEQRVWLQGFKPQLGDQQAAAGTLLHLHGYYDHGGLYPHLQRWALAHGLHYLAVDMPGHGLSSGSRASIDDFGIYQQFLRRLVDLLEKENLPRPWMLSGFSTGGAVALEHLLTNNCFDRIALLAPLVRPFGWKAARKWLPLASLFFSHLPRKFRANSHDAKFLEFIRDQDPLQARRLPLAWVKALNRWIPYIEKAPAAGEKVVIIQGEADTTVDWQYNLTVLHRLVPTAKTFLIKDCGHHLLNEVSEKRQETLDRLTQGLLKD